MEHNTSYQFGHTIGILDAMKFILENEGKSNLELQTGLYLLATQNTQQHAVHNNTPILGNSIGIYGTTPGIFFPRRIPQVGGQASGESSGENCKAQSH